MASFQADSSPQIGDCSGDLGFTIWSDPKPFLRPILRSFASGRIQTTHFFNDLSFATNH